MTDEHDKLEHATNLTELTMKADLQGRQLIAQYQEQSNVTAGTIKSTIGQLREEALQIRDAKILELRRKALDAMQAIQAGLDRDLGSANTDYAAAVVRLNMEEASRLVVNYERLRQTLTHLEGRTAAYLDKMREANLDTLKQAVSSFPKTYNEFVCDFTEGT